MMSERIAGSARAILLVAFVVVSGCERGARDARPAAVPPAPSPSTGGARTDTSGATQADQAERDMLTRLLLHYRETARAARVVLASASSEPVRYETEWLIKEYEHVAEHFEVALKELHVDAAEKVDSAMHEVTDPSTISDPHERERRFAMEIARNHERLVEFVRSYEYERFAAKSALLREIRLDVETSQTMQVQALQTAVFGKQ